MTRRDFLSLSGSIALSRWFPSQDFPGESQLAKLLERLRSNRLGMTMGDRVGFIGTCLVGTPYVAATLEVYDIQETCVANLAGLDCVTFYESCVALARMSIRGSKTGGDLRKELIALRYRGGKLDGYLSRLHYTTDWIADNTLRGNVKDLTPSLAGSQRLMKPINFMSTHPELYRQLKSNPSWVPEIAKIESRLKPAYVPKERVFEAERMLETGDIVGIATSKEGLDCSHTGLVLRDEDGPRLLHASSLEKKVVIGPVLSEYLKGSSSAIGIMACRPMTVR